MTFLSLFLFIVLVEGIASKSQVAHNGIVDVQDIKEGENDHDDRENDHVSRIEVHFSKESQKGCIFYVGNLKIIVAERVADSGKVDCSENETAGR